MSGQWRIGVDQAGCLKSGMCLAVAPGRFEFGPTGHARPTAELIDPDDDVLDAAISCMAEAITVAQSGTGKVIYPED